MQSASVESQKEILEWTLEPIRSSWIKKDWIYRPSNEAAYGDIYLAYDLNPDASATMVGRDSRWELYYEIQLLSKVCAFHILGIPVGDGNSSSAHLRLTPVTMLHHVKLLHTGIVSLEKQGFVS